MKKGICLVTGAGGLVGSECVKYFSGKFDKIIGIDDDSRRAFFGAGASVSGTVKKVMQGFENSSIALRDITRKGIERYFSHDVKLIIHCAAQPSHDWAASNPIRDFEVNAVGTLNVLEAFRKNCPDAVFIFCSTNKVYGDRPNQILRDVRFHEKEMRYDMLSDWKGFNERTGIDNSTHSLFGVSKTAADLMVQEYGKYFELKTGVFRCGCITGPSHQGAEQHGFLSYLVRCIKNEIPYTIYGYKGKQVRDQIHAYDLARVFQFYYEHPRFGEVYNMGGGTDINCSILEAIDIIEKKTGKKGVITYEDQKRKGDHIYYVSDTTKFRTEYPGWDYFYSLDEIIDELIEAA